MDQVVELKRNLSDEIDTIKNFMKLEERSSRVKSSFQKLQGVKKKLDKACGQLKTETVGSLSVIEKVIKDLS